MTPIRRIQKMPSGKREVPEQQEEPQKCKRQRHEESAQINGSNEEEKEHELSSTPAAVVRAGLFRTGATAGTFRDLPKAIIEYKIISFLDCKNQCNFSGVNSAAQKFAITVATLRKTQEKSFNGDELLAILAPLRKLSESTWIQLPARNPMGTNTLVTYWAEVTHMRELRFPQLHKLDLSGNKIGDEGAAALAPFLAKMTNLTNLDMSGNDTLTSGITDISDLRTLTNLIRLNLDWNEAITDVSALRTLTNLTNLDLSCNENLTDISALCTLTNLTNLDLSCNENLTDISDLIDALDNGRMPRLTILDMQGRNIRRSSIL